MKIPDFLGPATRISIRHVSTGSGSGPSVRSTLGGVTRAPGARRLPFAIQPQQQSRWCWAAVSASISRFYDAGSAWSQCDVVNTALARTDCCAEPSASDRSQCDQDGYLELALKITDNFDRMQQRPLLFDEIQAEVDKGNVIGCRIAWTGDGGHFVALRGWVVGASGSEYVDVSDPIYLESRVAYSQFASAYQSGADWTHSYWTRAVPASGGALVQVSAAVSVTHPEAIGA